CARDEGTGYLYGLDSW
nr:immunoglobulin heavy chain junction region [Macaca mulatta]MPN70771.1 immunoglobulin heavy chain junction region [Macaca mulatta]MPN71192.1 immunoglobulin heavy chain junction region [Macaca mulatta]MPN71429.1 immunoglobulin heavy chain junction region [Macaca mulatta]MPN71615.1 immunoglobulin heavy chain junction region [Macaca mulatta]